MSRSAILDDVLSRATCSPSVLEVFGSCATQVLDPRSWTNGPGAVSLMTAAFEPLRDSADVETVESLLSALSRLSLTGESATNEFGVLLAAAHVLARA